MLSRCRRFRLVVEPSEPPHRRVAVRLARTGDVLLELASPDGACERTTYWGDQGALLHVVLGNPKIGLHRLAVVIDLTTGHVYAGDPRHAQAPLGTVRMLERLFRGEMRSLPEFDRAMPTQWPSAAQLDAAAEPEAVPAAPPAAAPAAPMPQRATSAAAPLPRAAEAAAAAAKVAAAEALLAQNSEDGHYRLEQACIEQARHVVGAALAQDLVTAMRDAVVGGVPPSAARAAAALLARAEAAEITLGTYATGAGEGIASRRMACTIALARAWLVLADDAAQQADAAAALATAVRAEPNGVGEALADEVAEILRMVARRRG